MIKTPRLSIQLYSVRNEATSDYAATLQRISEMGFRCVEPAGYPGSSPAEAAALFPDLGLAAPSCHGQLPVGDDKNRIIEEALLMGHQAIITGCPPAFKDNYDSVDSVKAMADLYCEAADNAAPHGIQVGYHNHDWDFRDVEGTPGAIRFLELTPDSVLFEADLFWVARAGLDPAAFVRDLGPRGRFLHFKDGMVSKEAAFKEAETDSGRVMVSDAVPFLPAGAGQVDLTAAAAAMTHTDYVVVELDAYEGDMMEAVEQSFTYLTQQGIATP